MWISRSSYDQLVRQLAVAEAQLAALRLGHKALYRQMRVSERRAHEADTALTIDRHESFRTIRHLVNQFLRAKQIGAYPLPSSEEEAASKAVPEPRLPTFEEVIDPGELEALIATGREYGISREDVIATIKKEKGFGP